MSLLKKKKDDTGYTVRYDHKMADSRCLGVTKGNYVVIFYASIFGRVTLLYDLHNLYKHDIEVRSLNICLHQLTCIYVLAGRSVCSPPYALCIGLHVCLCLLVCSQCMLAFAGLELCMVAFPQSGYSMLYKSMTP